MGTKEVKDLKGHSSELRTEPLAEGHKFALFRQSGRRGDLARLVQVFTDESKARDRFAKERAKMRQGFVSLVDEETGKAIDRAYAYNNRTRW